MNDETRQAAIEAGARALWENDETIEPRPWEQASDYWREQFLADAEVCFDAMAPVIERASGEVRMTEEEYASMRQAVVAVARLRLMHRSYRGVADVDTCGSCPDMLYPCPTAKVLNEERRK